MGWLQHSHRAWPLVTPCVSGLTLGGGRSIHTSPAALLATSISRAHERTKPTNTALSVNRALRLKVKRP